ncbi:MAG: hypothetical protein RSD48_08065, partial [Oscillospiraceae bacterium]
MKTKHRLLALLLSLCMILSLMPLGAMAAEEGDSTPPKAETSVKDDSIKQEPTKTETVKQTLPEAPKSPAGNTRAGETPGWNAAG